MDKKEKDTKKEKKKRTSKQLFALAGVTVLVLIYIVTLITAIADTSGSGRWFRISLSATFALPLMIWIYSWMYGRLTGRHTIGDPDSSHQKVNDTPDQENDSGST